MPSRRDQLREITVEIVGEGYEPSFYELVAQLQREAGISHAEANRTVIRLLGRGVIRTNMRSGIVLGPSGGGSGGGIGKMLGITASVLGIITGVLGIWEFLVRNNQLPYPGPVGILFPSQAIVFPTIDASNFPTIPEGEKLGAPVATISGDCTDGFTITWGAIEGAENYQLRADDQFYATVDGTSRKVPTEHQVFGPRDYTVIARGLLPGTASDPSNAVTAPGC